MTDIIYLSQEQAYNLTTFKELIKLYTKKGPDKFAEAIDKNKARYKYLLDEVLATKEETSEEGIAA